MDSISNDPDRQELLKRLSTVSAQTILRHLHNETILEIASKCFEDKEKDITPVRFSKAQKSLDFMHLQQVLPQKENISKQAGDRAKRPLNAFIAFRSYYVKLFPESQQKAASGFLTTLWSKDPYRNRWAMIAKVYSFVRDEIGKKKAPLSSFLMAACPAMDILPPDEYLRVLGWVVEDTEQGTKKLVQRDELRVPKETTRVCPDSELELFQGMIELGYMPDENAFLLEALLAQDNRSTLASTISIAERASIRLDPVPSVSVPEPEIPTTTADKTNCVSNLEGSPLCCGTPRCSEDTSTPSTCTSISTPPTHTAALWPPASTSSHSMALLSDMTISTAGPPLGTVSESYFRPYYYSFVTEDPAACSPASSFGGDAGFGTRTASNAGYSAPDSSPAILSLDGVADHQAFDIDCPWDMSSALSQCTQPPSADRLFVLSSSPEYDPHEDFHFTF
ncbi:hypothetical protein V2A60_002175 [Cordyceps javanica]